MTLFPHFLDPPPPPPPCDVFFINLYLFTSEITNENYHLTF
jgi:hypothetical protein